LAGIGGRPASRDFHRQNSRKPLRCQRIRVSGFLTLHSRTQLAAENLFVRTQLALYLERQVKPHRADDATRITLATLAKAILGGLHLEYRLVPAA
jgi:hypothetical protein